MDVRFADKDLDRLETDPSFTNRLPEAVVSAFRKRLQGIRSAQDERDLRTMRSWCFEKLKGQRQDQCSMRLNDQYRLVLEIESAGRDRRVCIVGIEDYH